MKKKLAVVVVLFALGWTVKPLAQTQSGRAFSIFTQCRESCPGEACCRNNGGWVCC